MYFFFVVAGDADENVYVVQSGKLNVFITNSDGSSLSLKIVKTGESVTSLLSFTDVLTVSVFLLAVSCYFNIRNSWNNN